MSHQHEFKKFNCGGHIDRETGKTWGKKYTVKICGVCGIVVD